MSGVATAMRHRQSYSIFGRTDGRGHCTNTIAVYVDILTLYVLQKVAEDRHGLVEVIEVPLE